MVQIDISHLLPDISIATYAALTNKKVVEVVDTLRNTDDTISTTKDVPDIIKRYAAPRRELAIYSGVKLSSYGLFSTETCTLVVFGKDQKLSIQCTFEEKIHPLGEIYSILKGWIKQKEALNDGNNHPYEYTINGHIYQYDPWLEDVVGYADPLLLEGYPLLIEGIQLIANHYKETGDKLIKIRRDGKLLDDEDEACWLTLEVTGSEDQLTGKMILGTEDNEIRLSISGDILDFDPRQISFIHDQFVLRSQPYQQPQTED